MPSVSCYHAKLHVLQLGSMGVRGRNGWYCREEEVARWPQLAGLHARICTHAHARTRACMYVRACVRACMCVRACVRDFFYACARTCKPRPVRHCLTHKRTHARTHACRLARAAGPTCSHALQQHCEPNPCNHSLKLGGSPHKLFVRGSSLRLASMGLITKCMGRKRSS